MNKVDTTSRAEKLLQLIQSEFPTLAWEKYRFITEGWDHEVLILDEAVVFRFPDDEEYRALLRTEIEVLKRLEPVIPIAIPHYQYVAIDNSFAGYPLVLGKTLSKEFFDQLADSQKTAIAQQLASFLSVLHNLTLNGEDFSAVQKSYLPEDQKQVKRDVKKYLKKVLIAEELSRVDKILSEVDDLLDSELPVVLIHGDVYSRHLLWDEANEKLGIIDFSDMCLSDPAIDFAELYEYGQAFVEQVYAYYTGPKDNTFLHRARVYQKWIGVYMMTDHFLYHKTSFIEARETFDRTYELL